MECRARFIQEEEEDKEGVVTSGEAEDKQRTPIAEADPNQPSEWVAIGAHPHFTVSPRSLNPIQRVRNASNAFPSVLHEV